MTENLDKKPLYRSTARIRLGNTDATATVGIKPTGLDTSFPDGQILHHDLEGRLLRIATPNVQWRRGLSHRAVRLRKRSLEEGGGFEQALLSDPDQTHLLDEATVRMEQLHAVMCDASRGQYSRERKMQGPFADEQALPRLDEVVARAAAFDGDAARADLARFHALYGDIPILPPDQYQSLVLLATDGCVYNRCTFCGFYRNVPYRRRSAEPFREHLQEAVAYHGGGLAARRNIFLGQANALVGPREWRESLLETIHEHFDFPPDDRAATRTRWWQGSGRRFQDISSFLDSFTGVRISVEEFSAMRQRHVRRLYLGVESGDDGLLSWLEKPATSEKMLAVVKNIKQAGLEVGVILLLGAGGERFYDAHVEGTVELLRKMDLGQGDYIYLSPLVDTQHAEYMQRAQADHVEPLTSARITEQAERIRAGLESKPRKQRPYIARYEVTHFVY